jgi:prevent-host-death family protein
MTIIVSAADANRRFSEILREASLGTPVLITRRGKPVARLMPMDVPTSDARGMALDRLLSTLETGLRLGGDRFDRDALYDR